MSNGLKGRFFFYFMAISLFSSIVESIGDYIFLGIQKLMIFFVTPGRAKISPSAVKRSLFMYFTFFYSFTVATPILVGILVVDSVEDSTIGKWCALDVDITYFLAYIIWSLSGFSRYCKEASYSLQVASFLIPIFGGMYHRIMLSDESNQL